MSDIHTFIRVMRDYGKLLADSEEQIDGSQQREIFGYWESQLCRDTFLPEERLRNIVGICPYGRDHWETRCDEMGCNGEQSFGSFHIGDILSTTSGIVIGPNNIAGVFELTQYMTESGDDMSSFGVIVSNPRVVDSILKQHPALSHILIPNNLDDYGVERFVDEITQSFGTHLTLKTIREFENQ